MVGTNRPNGNLHLGWFCIASRNEGDTSINLLASLGGSQCMGPLRTMSTSSKYCAGIITSPPVRDSGCRRPRSSFTKCRRFWSCACHDISADPCCCGGRGRSNRSWIHLWASPCDVMDIVHPVWFIARSFRPYFRRCPCDILNVKDPGAMQITTNVSSIPIRCAWGS